MAVHIMIIIIIVWLVHCRTLPFLRACSRLDDCALSDRQLQDHRWVVLDQIQWSWARLWCGRPDWRLQSLGKEATWALRARLWFIACAVWPKNLTRVVQMVCVSHGWSVSWQTSSLMWALHKVCNMRRKYHWSNASRFLTSCRVEDHVSAP